jgi:CDP-glucose 4,6-dehydratase
MFSDIYRGKKVFVTGDSGFKGSWLTLWLQKLGAEVFGFSLDIPSTPSHSQLLNLDYHKTIGDIRNLQSIQKAINEVEPDIIFHLAAQPLVRKSYSSPIETFETNIMGTANLLEVVRNCSSVKAVVVVTSDKCYENREDGKPFIEGDSLGGFDPYSASKGAAEIITSSYRESFFNLKNYKKTHETLIASVRAGNVIGGGDWGEDRLLPDLMVSASENKPVEIRSPEAIRPWQFVLEPLSGYLLVGEKLLLRDKTVSTSWNLGPEINDHKTVREVVEISQKEWTNISVKISNKLPDLHEAKLLSLDCAKAKEELGWSPIWNSEKAVEKSVEWYREFYDNGTVISENQLDLFTETTRKSGGVWVN